MSESEAKRFIKDVRQNETMRAEAKTTGGYDALAMYGQGKGYEVTAEELRNMSKKYGKTSEDVLGTDSGVSPTLLRWKL
jgi:predicted ribosomally synthesized peptide with nif11-like leader